MNISAKGNFSCPKTKLNIAHVCDEGMTPVKQSIVLADKIIGQRN